MDDTEANRAALGTWLTRHLDGARRVEVAAFDAPRSGYSADTTVIEAAVERDGGGTTERFVVRCETPEPAVYPVQAPGLDVEIAVQYRAMEAVARSSTVPIAPLVGYEPDPSVLGTPFFVMGHVAGEVPVESPIYTSAGFFFEATDEQRHRLVTEGLRVLADVHRIDWRAAGLEWLVPPGTVPGNRAQLELWDAYTRRELAGRPHPLLEDTFEWLRARCPADVSLGLSWGDPRPGNIIWQDFRPACATDFEACSIAPPEHDLGWWLMFDHWSHETMGVDRLPGEPTRDEQRELYERYLGRSVGDTTWYEIFAAARYGAIVVRVMNRLVERGVMPADQTVWIDNPAVTCLAALRGA